MPSQREILTFHKMAAGTDPLSPQVRGEQARHGKGHVPSQTIFQESWKFPWSLGVIRFPLISEYGKNITHNPKSLLVRAHNPEKHLLSDSPETPFQLQSNHSNR